MKVHILDDWFDTLRSLPCFAKLDAHDVTVWNDHVEDVEILASRLQGVEALVLFRERTRITRELLELLPGLRLISQRSVYPHIDLDACTEHDVLLCSNMHSDTPSYAAAELTWALILAAFRQLPAQMASLKEGKWQSGVGKSLRGRRIGLYGYGRIARVVAGYARSFGMDVLWWGSDEGRMRASADSQAVAPSRQEFFRSCDIISLHVRLKPATRSIITPDDFSCMSPGALFVNTSRAGLIEKGALLAALDNGRPGMAAIDVFDQEPVVDRDDPLLNHPNLIATPHIGFVTEDEYNLQFSDIFDQINAYSDGVPIHMVNPEVWRP